MTGGATTDVERMMQQALDQAGTAIYLLDRRRRFLFFNDVGRALMPDPAAVEVGKDMFELNPFLAGHVFGDAILRASNARIPGTSRARSERLGAWFEMSCFPVDHGVAIYCRNIDDEYETQQLLESADRRLRRKGALLDAASDAIYVRELDGTISYWNKGAERIFGWTSAEVLGRPAAELLAADPLSFQESADTVTRDGQWLGLLEQTTREGARLKVHCRWQLATDEDGSPLFVLCMGSDLTAFTREQDRTYRAQRMESLGTLAGGIAHDLNNVLTPVLIAVQLLQLDDRDDGTADLLRSVEASVTHGAQMIRQVLSFARGEEGERSLVEVADLVAEVVAFARDTLPKSIEVGSRVGAGIGPINCDHTQILQILVNLVTNARDAMPEGGSLVVSAGRRSPDGGLGALGSATETIVIEVEDTGSGMDEDTASRVFEPFFTTKAQGSGTGLGLSTSLAIARGHGGTLEVYSEPGRGTRFQLRLPGASGAPSTGSDRVGADSVLPRGDGQLVLVVDDDATIRSLTQRTLEQYGYRTVAAENGVHAKAVVDDDRVEVHLVLTDMMMPVMDGAALIAYLHEHHPAVPVIAASGLTTNVEAARGDQHSVRYFLPKPFTATELLQSVGRVIREKA